MWGQGTEAAKRSVLFRERGRWGGEVGRVEAGPGQSGETLGGVWSVAGDREPVVSNGPQQLGWNQGQGSKPARKGNGKTGRNEVPGR